MFLPSDIPFIAPVAVVVALPVLFFGVVIDGRRGGLVETIQHGPGAVLEIAAGACKLILEFVKEGFFDLKGPFDSQDGEISGKTTPEGPYNFASDAEEKQGRTCARNVREAPKRPLRDVLGDFLYQCTRGALTNVLRAVLRLFRVASRLASQAHGFLKALAYYGKYEI